MSEWVETAYPGYLVNDRGDVLGPRGRKLRQQLRGAGYPSVTVTKDQVVYVHVLVCTAFHGPKPSPLHQVAHGNGQPTDNRPANLRWATPAENTADSVMHGTFPLRRGGHGEANGNARLTTDQVAAMRAEYATGTVSQAELGRRYGIGKSQVHNIVKGRRWRREEWRPA